MDYAKLLFENVMLLYKPTQMCIERTGKVIDILRRKGVNLKVYSIDDAVIVEEPPDLTIGLGGDGTILRISTVLSKYSPLVLPLPCGKRTVFYEKIEPEEYEEVFERIFNGFFRIEYLRRIGLTTMDKQYVALNEALIISSDSGRVTSFNIEIATLTKTIKYSFDGDGVIIGPSPGSTAYNLSIGGSMIDPNVDCIFVNALNPLDRGLTQITAPFISTIRVFSKGFTELYIDGAKICDLPPKHVVKLYPTLLKLRVIRVKEKNFIRDVYEKRRFSFE